MHTDRDRLRAGLLLLGAVGFAILGQLYFTHRREFVWDGIIFFSLALICLAQLMSSATLPVRADARDQTPIWHQRGLRLLSHRQAAPTIFALLANLIAARSANTQPPPTNFSFSVLLWLASLLLLWVTFVPPLQLLRSTLLAIRNARYALRSNRRNAIELALVLGLLIAGLVLRAWNLDQIPANLSGDEGTQGMWAVDVLRGHLRNPFSTGWFSVPTMSFFAQAASLRLFGDNVTGLRALSALIGTATLAFTYLLARRTLKRRVALFALAALSFSHYHIHFSRLGSNQIADPLFMVLTLWLLSQGLRRSEGKARETSDEPKAPPRNTHPWFLAAGVTMGLSWYGYFGSRVIALVVALYLVTQAIGNRDFLRRHAGALACMALMALMLISPLLLHYVNHPENFTARFNQVNFFRWLENELSRPDHDSTFNLVLHQVWRSISAFNYTLDPTFWYRAQIPLLDFVSGILFLLGVLVAISRWRRPVVRFILYWFGLALMFGWVLTENPPSSMRMVIISPALALLVAFGLDRLLTLAHWAIGGRRTQWNWVGVALMTLAAILNVHYYFTVYTPTRVYGNPSAETATVLARYLLDASEHQTSAPSVFFYGPPFMYYDFGSIQFIARNVPGTSVPPKDQDPGFSAHVTGPTLFVVLRERLDELEVIQTQYPNGRPIEFHSTADGRLMFVIYQVFP